MKKTIILIFLSALSSLTTMAQDNGQQQTLFGDFNIYSSGGYGGPAARFSAIDGQFAAFFGGYGAWFINQKFSIGGGGFGLVSNLPVPERDRFDPGLDLHYDMGYGGFMVGYTISSNRIIHLHADILIGGGEIEQDFEGEGDFTATESEFFVTEPGAHLEVNIAPFMRATGGVTYRLVSGSDTPGLRDRDLSSMSFAISLKFGYFD